MQQQQQQNVNNPASQPASVGMLNTNYLKKVFFQIKLGIVLVLIAGDISASVRYDILMSSRYYNFTAVTGIIIAVLLILIHLFRVAEKLDRVPWNFIEMVYDLTWAMLFLIAASILTDCARKYENMSSYIAGAFFGFAAMLLYLIDAMLRFIAWKRGVSEAVIINTKSVPLPQPAKV